MPRLDSKEERQYSIEGKLIPLGYQQITSVAAAQNLRPPTHARIAIIQVTGQPCRWRDDGTAPTTTVGMLLPVNTLMTYTGDLTQFAIIETTTSAVVNISYYF